MNRRDLVRLDRELRSYLQEMIEGTGRPERRAAMGSYVTGLLLDGERKSMVPMAARPAESPNDAEAVRQRLQQVVCVADWADAVLKQRVALKLERELADVEALVSIATRRSARSRTDSSPSAGRFSPRSRGWTLPEVRRHLQAVLLYWVGTCPLCGRPVDLANLSRGPSRL